MKQWYQTLFENYAKKYDQEVFTQGTIGECDFIESELGYYKSLKILDIGCGTGRHAIELSRRGYHVTGVDLSASQLKRAQEKALEAGLNIQFLQADARDLPFNKKFDLAMMICEGAFPLMETDEMNFSILQSATKALKANGKLIFTTLNGLFPLFHSVKDFLDAATTEGGATCTHNTFDLMTFRDHNLTTFEDDDGNPSTIESNERYYVPSEISWLLKTSGYKTIDIYSARLGAFSRMHKLTTEDFEMLVVAVR